MKRNKKMMVVTVLTAFLVLPGMVVFAVQTDQPGSIELKNAAEANFPELAKISLDQAVKAALQAVPGKALRVELENEDGYLVYGVEVAGLDHQFTDVKVDAGNGKILKADRDEADGEAQTEHAEGEHED